MKRRREHLLPTPFLYMPQTLGVGPTESRHLRLLLESLARRHCFIRGDFFL